MPPKRKSGGRSASAPVAKKGRLAKRSAPRDEDSSDSDLDDFGTDSSDSDDDDNDDDDDDEFDPEKLIADDDDMAYLNGLDEVEREAILAERYEKKLEELELKKAAKEQKRLQAQEKGKKKKKIVEEEEEEEEDELIDEDIEEVRRDAVCSVGCSGTLSKHETLNAY